MGVYNPFRYRSYYYDEGTELYYLNSRYYDPSVGRFISPDGFVGANGDIDGYNLYAYCNNDPVNYADESGAMKRPVQKYVNDGAKHTYGRTGIISSSDYNDLCSFYTPRKVNNKSTSSFALYDSDRIHKDAIFHEQIIVAEYSSPSLNIKDGNIGIGGVSADFYTGAWEGEYMTFSLFDFGHVEGTAEITGTGISCGAMASAWSPSLAINVHGLSLEIGAEVGSVGASLNIGTKSISATGSFLWGITVSVAW